MIYPFIENKPLQAGKVFSALAYFNILGLPLYLVTMIINIMTHSKVSTDRLSSFFMAPEIEGEKKSGSLEKVREWSTKGCFRILINAGDACG